MLCTAALGASGLAIADAGPAVAAPATLPGHDRVVSATPKAETPNVQDESVDAIYDAGEKIIAAGDFSRVRNPGSGADKVRASIFAFNEKTGVVDEDFAPEVDGAVNAVIGGPTTGTVYIAGRFKTVNGVNRPKVALVKVADGSLVSTFKGPSFDGAVNDIKLVDGHLVVAGNFTGNAAGSPSRKGLASLNPNTGALDGYLTAAVTENHSWTSGSPDGTAKAAVGVDKVAVSPDGSKLVAIGNFKKVNGATHDQVVKINLTATSATVSSWDTERYRPVCNTTKFDSYVRDVAFSPDGSYFAIVTTGGPVADTLCDTATRWPAAATGSGQQPEWIARSGGDTMLSVAVSEQAVYVGGHIRWMNNPLGKDAAGPGAVGRASIAALDPNNGLPLSWNPGRNPRGYGVTEMYLTPQGLWIGHDQEWIGNKDYRHERIAFFPLSGGVPAHSTAARSLPGSVYLLGSNAPVAALFRVNAGGEMVAAADGGPNWQADTASAPSRYHNSGLRFNAGKTWIPEMLIPPISARTPREIFNSELVGSGTAPNMNWDLPIAKGTKITVRLYFSTRCGCTAGSRKFNINIDGVRKLTDFDPTAAAGGDNIGTMRAFNVTSDGNVDVDLLKVVGSPLINAIEIVRDPVPALVGTENNAYKRSFDGSAVGSRVQITGDDFPWEGGRGGFWVGGTLYYAHGRNFYRRTFDGKTFGPAQFVNPYSDPKWDKAITSSGPAGQTFAGKQTDFHYELPSITGMFYEAGRLYYTIAGHPALYWRWFSPDSGATGTERNTVAGTSTFADAGGMFVSGGRLYLVNRVNGNLTRMTWSNGAPSGTATTVSGPTVDKVDWRAKVVALGP